MARPREFDPNEALEKAMCVFWARGYEAASVNALSEAMALSKSSLYDTFGSKHELFLRAIEHYLQTRFVPSLSVLDQAGSARDAIAARFGHLVDHLVSEEGRKGCLVVSSTLELAQRDAAVASRVGAAMKRMEDAYVATIARGQKAGEIAPEKDARALARLLVACINGLIVMGTANASKRTLNDVAGAAMAGI